MRIAAMLGVGLLLFSTLSWGQEYQAHFPPEEFKARRDKVFDRIGDNAVAVLQGAPDPGGYIYPRQSNAFYYLCGVENPHSYLLLDGRMRKATLYLAGNGQGRGARVLSAENPDGAKKMTGVDEVLPADKLAGICVGVQGRNTRAPADFWDGRVSREANFIALKPEYEKAARQLVRTGGGVFSHTVGMAVHDVGGYASAPLKKGQVFSIDPQLRVPEENLYLRIEDTVVVTDDGVEILTRLAPMELDEIEKLVL